MILELDEAIKHYEEVAEYKEDVCKTIENEEGEFADNNTYYKYCKRRAREHRQLAEWLRELEAYRDGCHCDTCKYSDKNIKNRPCGYCGDNESNWEYKGEVKADDTNRCEN